MYQLFHWSEAVESLKVVNLYNFGRRRSTAFAEAYYLIDFIDIMVEQRPSKIGSQERSFVEECLQQAVMIIAKDLRIQKPEMANVLLNVLAFVFKRGRL